MDFHGPGVWIVVVSEVAAFWLIVRLWRSADRVFFKVTLSLLALVPVLGPLLAFWISDFPDEEPEVLQAPRPRGTFYGRWRGVLEARSPILRFRYWRELMTSERNEDP